MRNEYDIRGDTTAIFLHSRKYGRMETLIATSDLPRAQEYPGRWRPHWQPGTSSFYVRGGVGRTGCISFHRWIMRVDDSVVSVDHLLHDTLDNCRWALKVGSHKDNMQNKRTYRNNTSGHRGVYWHKRLQRWQASIQRDGRQVHIGYFQNKDDAIAARKLAAAETKIQRSVAN